MNAIHNSAVLSRWVVTVTILSGTLAAQSSLPGLLIRNGLLIDGTGAAPRPADVRVSGDAIVEIGDSLTPGAGERTIDAGGKVVAPGFIDVHSHADRGLEDAPDAASQVHQGITTAIVGQDGGGELPISAFLDNIDRVKPSINYATTVGHGTVRGLVMGGDFKRAATRAELETMKALVERGMKDGALGLSSGLEYDPGFYAKPEELAELAKVAARHRGYYTSHVRDEENDVLAAWKEAIDVGRLAGLPVLLSHIKLAAKPVWGKTAEALKLLEDANRAGVRVRADWYPYTYWQSSMYVLIPDRDFENRQKWEVGLDEIGGAQNVLVTNYRPNPAWNGKTVADIARPATASASSGRRWTKRICRSSRLTRSRSSAPMVACLAGTRAATARFHVCSPPTFASRERWICRERSTR
jgi:N-acyl-D-amino-acid deacylase